MTKKIVKLFTITISGNDADADWANNVIDKHLIKERLCAIEEENNLEITVEENTS